MEKNVLFHMVQKIKKPALYALFSIVAAFLFLGASMLWGGGRREMSVQHALSVTLPEAPKSSTAPTGVPQIDYARIQEKFRGKDVERVQTHEKLFALTFDGGGNARGAQKILAALSEHGITATFFLTGHFIKEFPDMASAIQKGGGEIANHTMTHKDLSTLSKEEVAAEVTGMERAAKERAITVAPFFRFPYGAPTKETIALVNEHGYVSVRWTVDSLGWQGSTKGHDAEFVAERVIQKAVKGGIALMHLGSANDGSSLDADALEQIIASLQQQGYRFVSLSELFNVAITK